MAKAIRRRSLTGRGSRISTRVYLRFYQQALQANGIGYDVYDTDAHDRTAPDALGVLSHYKAIVWYTGDNVRTIEPDQPPTGAGASKLSDDEFRAVRDFLNEGGKLLYTGKRAGWDLSNQFVFNAQGNPPYCNAGGGAPTGACIPLSNDFLQYYLGSYGNNALRTNKAELDGVTIDFFDPMEAPTATLNGGDSADNQDFAWTLTPTSTVLPADKYPQFKSTEVGDYSINGPLAPKTGDYYMYSQVGDHANKRLTRTIDLTAKPSGTLRFSTSYDLEPDYDYMFVEAHTVGSDADWTTLPDENGNTSTELDPTAGSCSDGWAQPDGQHPWLAHYVNPDTCDPHGTADTLYFGFGLEGVQGAGTRNEIMKSAMRYLGILNAGRRQHAAGWRHPQRRRQRERWEQGRPQRSRLQADAAGGPAPQSQGQAVLRPDGGQAVVLLTRGDDGELRRATARVTMVPKARKKR